MSYFGFLAGVTLKVAIVQRSGGWSVSLLRLRSRARFKDELPDHIVLVRLDHSDQQAGVTLKFEAFRCMVIVRRDLTSAEKPESY